MEEIKIGDKVFIRNIGKDEYWLQDVIYGGKKGDMQIVIDAGGEWG